MTDQMILAQSQVGMTPAVAIPEQLQPQNKSVIILKRKCVDILCAIFFVLFWGTCLFLILYYKAWENLKYSDVIFSPHDQFRRRCGGNQDNQADPLAMDYSKIMTDTSDFKQFCIDMQTIYQHSHNCDTLFGTTWNNVEIRKFFADMSQYGRDQTNYSAGFSAGSTKFCVAESDVQGTDTSEFCNPPSNATYVCSSDLKTFYEKLVTSSPQTTISSCFLTNEEYQKIENDLTTTHKYALKFCTELPKVNIASTEKRKDYIQNPISQVFGQTTCTKIIFGLNQNAIIQGAISQLEGFLSNMLGQIVDNYLYIIYGTICALGITIIYMLILRFFVAPIVWISIIGAILFFIGFGAFFIYNYVILIRQNELQYEYFGYKDQATSNRSDFYIAFGVIFLLIALVGIILVAVFGKTIRICVAVIKQSMICVQAMPHIFTFPIFTIILICAHLAWSAFFAYMFYLTGTYDASVNYYNFVTYERNDEYALVEKWDWYNSSFFFFMVFGCIWGVFFFYHLLEFNISAMVVQWYFTRDRSCRGLRGSFCQTIKFGILSLGTIFFSSFITTWVVFIRFVFEYVVKRVEKANQVANNKVVKTCICCVRCCLKCLQKFIMWINRCIQIYACISGQSYCKSMVHAMRLLMAKFLSNIFAKGLSTFFLIIGKIFVTVGGGILCGVMIYFLNGKQIAVAACILCAVCSFIIAYYILEVVQLVIDTIYFCFLYEETYMMREREAGDEPYAPGDLKNAL